MSSSNSVLTGFGIAISSPIVIAFWISLSGSYLLQFPSKDLAFLNILLINMGFVLFHLILASSINFTKHKIPSRHVVLLSKIFGIILILYGANFFYKLIGLLI
jgi:threonine/homoserine/homoserine lactone efflux protein